MSKFFFKGKIEPKPKHHSVGFSTKRASKPGSETNPLELCVTSDERKAEIELLLQENGLHAVIEVNEDKPEELTALDTLLKKPETVTFEKVPGRNDPCVCGSGKKYKKCCG